MDSASQYAGAGGRARKVERGTDSGLQENVPASARFDEDHTTWRVRLRCWLRVEPRQEPMPSHLGIVEDARPEAYAVCCSGGGVRSAAFNLGALQGLARTPYLGLSRYVAAVSGGSYIAAAMAMVARTGKDGSDEELLREQAPFAPGSPEEQYLRNRSNYMAPGAGGKVRLPLRRVGGVVGDFFFFFLFLPLFGAAVALFFPWVFPAPVAGRTT